MREFEKLLADLATNDVAFIVVGGLAVAFCGYVRATEDVDILIDASTPNVTRLLTTLENFGDGAAAELSPSDFTMEEGAIRIVESFPLDVFTQMSGYTYENLIPKTTLRDVNGGQIRHLNPEGLILLKKDSLRPKDQIDVEALRRLRE